MDQSFGLFFHLKKNKSVSTNELTVYLRITVDGIYSEVSTKRKCDPDNWNVSAGRLYGKSEAAREFNYYLDTLQQKVFETKRRLIEMDKELTAETIKNELLGRNNNPKYMLLEVFKHHNTQMAALVNREYAPGTLERYETSYRHTESFLQWKFKLNDIAIDKLNYEFITEYEFWLKSVRNCGHNTTMKYLANFKKIVIRCLKNGWLQKDPFIGFNMAKREVERTALTEHELQLLSAKSFSAERLSIVKDIFLFSCYSGLAYADVQKLKRSEIRIGIDGEKWIFTRRQKTDSSSRIPLLPPALHILERYTKHPQCKFGDKVLPVLSNQKMNAYLKEIADVCGITKNLTYHIARHTFATTVTLSNGVPIETVSKMLGHRNLKTTQHYAKILDMKVSEDMKNLKNRLCNK
ncbi:MAG: site-specific integrase [Bacteroidota bacterium]|nr:site-specific integrase [Bacteroidota bacterium]